MSCLLMGRKPAADSDLLHAILAPACASHGVLLGPDFREACRRGVCSAAAYLRKIRQYENSADAMVLAYVIAYLGKHKSTSGPSRLTGILETLCSIDGHLAMWALSCLGHEILDALDTSDDDMMPLHRLMDTIAGMNNEASLPIMSLGSLDDPAVRVCCDLCGVLLKLPHDRGKMCKAVLICWQERFCTPIAWALERKAKAKAQESIPSLDVARARRSTDSVAYNRWACGLVLDYVLGYPARS
jgi:hypothetical protein